MQIVRAAHVPKGLHTDTGSTDCTRRNAQKRGPKVLVLVGGAGILQGIS